MNTDPETMASRELYADALRARIAATDKQIEQAEAVNAQLRADAATIARLEKELAEARGAIKRWAGLLENEVSKCCGQYAGMKPCDGLGCGWVKNFAEDMGCFLSALSSPAKAECPECRGSGWMAGPDITGESVQIQCKRCRATGPAPVDSAPPEEGGGE